MPKTPITLTQFEGTLIINALRNCAATQNAAIPQYKNHWDGPEWVLIQVIKPIRTKLGIAFSQGEVALAKRDTLEEEAVWTAYSMSNKCDTVISLKKAVPLWPR